MPPSSIAVRRTLQPITKVKGRWKSWGLQFITAAIFNRCTQNTATHQESEGPMEALGPAIHHYPKTELLPWNGSQYIPEGVAKTNFMGLSM
jgi:hypothetical protein